MYRFTTTMMTFALAVGLQSAHAASPENMPSVVVRFPDLDLSSGAGVALLYQRLRGAAETVCAPLDDRDLPRHARFKACMRGAIGTAVAKIDRPALTTYYQARTEDRGATILVARK
jgi:UrcA family protein